MSTSSYLELKTVADARIVADMSGYRLPKAAFKRMKRDMVEVKAGLEGGQAVSYKTAWLDYVRTVWAEVADRLNGGDEVEHSEVTNGSSPDETTG